jgi:hypothetical protein
VFFLDRDRERLEATDSKTTELTLNHANLAEKVIEHNRRCERWQFWMVTGYVTVSLIVIGFLVEISVFSRLKG